MKQRIKKSEKCVPELEKKVDDAATTHLQGDSSGIKPSGVLVNGKD